MKNSKLKKIVIPVISSIVIILGAVFGFNTDKITRFLNSMNEQPTQTAEEPTEEAAQPLFPEETEEENDSQYEDSPYEYDEQYQVEVSESSEYEYSLTFYSQELLEQHYKKHGIEMGFSSPEEYEKAANRVVENTASLHKTEKEDGDDVYYLESTNEFVIVSTSGYIRTYFLPDAGISYFNKQ